MKVLLLDKENMFSDGSLAGLVNPDLSALPCAKYSDALDLAQNDGDIGALLICVGKIDESLSRFVRQMKTTSVKMRAIAIMSSPNVDDYIALTLNGVDECFTMPVDTALFSWALSKLTGQSLANIH